jgi:hypothetical protein
MGRLERVNEERRKELGAIDRMGRPVREGDIVVLLHAQVPMFKVTSVAPQLDPSGPKGLVIQALSTVQCFTPPGIPFNDMLRVATQSAPTVLEADTEALRPKPEGNPNGNQSLLARVSTGLRRLWPVGAEGTTKSD